MVWRVVDMPIEFLMKWSKLFVMRLVAGTSPSKSTKQNGRSATTNTATWLNVFWIATWLSMIDISPNRECRHQPETCCLLIVHLRRKDLNRADVQTLSRCQFCCTFPTRKFNITSFSKIRMFCSVASPYWLIHLGCSLLRLIDHHPTLPDCCNTSRGSNMGQ